MEKALPKKLLSAKTFMEKALEKKIEKRLVKRLNPSEKNASIYGLTEKGKQIVKTIKNSTRKSVAFPIYVYIPAD